MDRTLKLAARLGIRHALAMEVRGKRKRQNVTRNGLHRCIFEGHPEGRGGDGGEDALPCAAERLLGEFLRDESCRSPLLLFCQYDGGVHCLFWAHAIAPLLLSCLRFPPLATQDQVVVVLQSGALVGLSTEDGHALWSQPGGSVIAPAFAPVELEDQVLLAFNDGQIVRLSRDGKVTLRIKPNGLVSSPILVRDGEPIFGLSSGQLVGWDVKENRARWTVPFKGVPARIAPAAGGRLLVVTDRGKIVLIEVEGGKVAWEASAGERVVDGPTEFGELTVVRTVDHRLVTIDRKGSVASRRALQPPHQAGLFPAGGSVVLLEEEPGGGTQIVELDPASSRETARRTVPYSATQVLDLEGSIGLVLRGGELLKLETRSQRPEWGYRPRTGKVTSGTSRAGRIYLSVDSGEIAAFR